MKKYTQLNFFIVAFLSVISLQAKAQVNSLLWEIYGNGAADTSYLFGTMHLIPQTDFFLPEGTEKRLISSRKLILEMDISDPTLQFKLMIAMQMESGKTLGELYSDKEFKQLENKLHRRYNMELSTFYSMKPIFIQQSLIMNEMMEREFTSYEGYFMEVAKNNEIILKGLETIDQQISALNSIPEKEQAKTLLKSVKNKSNGQKEVSRLIKLYKKQDVEALYQSVLTKKSGFKNYEEELLNNRNKNWIPHLTDMIKEGKVFVAVGAAHLGGENGVISLLKKEGFEVKSVLTQN